MSNRPDIASLSNTGDLDTGAFPLVSRRSSTTIVEIGGVPIGGRELALMAGPCSVESEEQLRAAARAARAAGATILRGGTFKPRTSPYSFQGLGEEGLELLRLIGTEMGLPVVTEAVEPGHVPLVAAHADAIQIGSRNMHVTPLLRAAAASGLPVLLKRGMSATLEEFLLAAETIVLAGNDQVVLCERGIRTFDSYTRNCLDVGGIAALKRLSRLPVIADPSHATGRRELVTDAALAGVAAGADGLLVEAHPDPASARSDAGQQLSPAELADLAKRVNRVAVAVGRTLATRSVPGPRVHRRRLRTVGSPPTSDPIILELRQEISDNDRRIVEAVNRRIELVESMRTYKDSRGIPFHDPEREESLLDFLGQTNSGPLSESGVEEIVEALLNVTKRELGRREADGPASAGS
jgi:3-deoxy-7-phosphoheptulonate synthase